MTRLWLLDFDGTLVDSEKTIKACYLKAAQEFIPKREKIIKKMIIGASLEETSKLILTKKNLHLLENFKKKFQELYDGYMVLETKQYPDAHSTLCKLHEQGDHLAILTNKRSKPTNELINFYGWNYLFKWIFCIDDYPIIKNKSELLKLKKEKLKRYKKIYLVGDTLTDAKAAYENNISFIYANYGYGKVEQIFKKKFIEIDNLKALLQI